MLTTEQIPIDLRLIRRDENLDHWNIPAHLKPYIAGFYGVYLYDKNAVTHCCEITPSYELNFLYLQAVSTPGMEIPENIAEQIADLEVEGATCEEHVCYVHVHALDSAAARPGYGYTCEWAQDEGDSREETIQNACEHYRCNYVL